MVRRLSVLAAVGWVILAAVVGVAPVAAQASTDMEEAVVMCVAPVNDETGAGPYLVGFRGAARVGVILPQESIVTLYSAANVPVVARFHHVLPDATTGGYRRVGPVGAVYTTWDAAPQNACIDRVQPLLGADMLMSMPFTVTSNQALLFERGGDGSTLDDAPLVGAMALHFVPTYSLGLTDIQLIQMDVAPIDVFFPFLPQYSRMALVANKDVSMEVCYSLDVDGPCTRPQLVNERRVFVEDLKREQPPVNLYTVMRTGMIRLYPAWGLVIEYPTEGAIRLSPSDSPAQRDPAFEAGQRVSPIELDGVQVFYYVNELGTSNVARGDLDGQSSSLAVVGIDGLGQLVVEAGGESRVIEAWLVDVSE